MFKIFRIASALIFTFCVGQIIYCAEIVNRGPSLSLRPKVEFLMVTNTSNVKGRSDNYYGKIWGIEGNFKYQKLKEVYLNLLAKYGSAENKNDEFLHKHTNRNFEGGMGYTFGGNKYLCSFFLSVGNDLLLERRDDKSSEADIEIDEIRFNGVYVTIGLDYKLFFNENFSTGCVLGVGTQITNPYITHRGGLDNSDSDINWEKKTKYKGNRTVRFMAAFPITWHIGSLFLGLEVSYMFLPIKLKGDPKIVKGSETVKLKDIVDQSTHFIGLTLTFGKFF